MKQNLTVNFTSDGCFFGTPRMHKLDTILQTAVLESIFLHHHDHNKQVNIPFPSHRNRVFCQTLLCLNGSACKRHNKNSKFNKQSTVPRSCNHVLFVKKKCKHPGCSTAHVIINITERSFSPRQCFPSSSQLAAKATTAKLHSKSGHISLARALEIRAKRQVRAVLLEHSDLGGLFIQFYLPRHDSGPN